MSQNSSNKEQKKKPYKKPELRTEQILEAGLGGSCNSTSGGRKQTTAGGCSASKLIC